MDETKLRKLAGIKESEEGYCIPTNVGTRSTQNSINKYLGYILDAVEWIDHYTAKGEIVEDVKNFKLKLLNGLKSDGYTIEANGNNWIVKKKS